MAKDQKTQKAQAQARAERRVIIDRDEYNALIGLRDGAHDAALGRIRKLEADVSELNQVNSKQIHLLNMADMKVRHLIEALERIEKRDGVLRTRIVELESREDVPDPAVQQVLQRVEQVYEEMRRYVEAFRPLKFSAPQPTIGSGGDKK